MANQKKILDHECLQAQWDTDGKIYISAREGGQAATIVLDTEQASMFVNEINNAIEFAKECFVLEM